MLKPILAFAALGVAGILLLPLFGIILGFVFTLLKIALVIFLVFLAYKLFEKLSKPKGPEIVS